MGDRPPLTEAGGMFDPDVPFPQPLLARLKALELVRKDAWELVKNKTKTFESGTTKVPHKFQIGDPVLIRLHRSGNLEPRWKGPYLVLLTSSPLGQPCSPGPAHTHQALHRNLLPLSYH